MELANQITKLSENPIFFISPNIGIKFDLIKKNSNLINRKYSLLFSQVLEGKNNFLNKDLDEELLIAIMIDYLYTQKSDYLKNLNLDLLIYQMKEKDIFYANAFLAYYYYDNSNYEKAEKHVKYLLNYIELHDVTDYEKMCVYSLTAYFLKTQSIFINSAEEYFINALELINVEDYLGKISLLNSFAYYYHNIEKREKALEYIDIALGLVEKYDLGVSSFTTYKNAGIIFTTIGNFDKAKWSFKKAFEVFYDLVDNPEENVKLLNTLGYVEFLKGDFDESLKNHDKALESLVDSYNNVTKLLDEAVKTLGNLGNIYKFLGYIEKSLSIQIFEQEIMERVNSINRLNEYHNLKKTYIELSKTYLLYKNDYKNANFYLELSKEKLEENDNYIDKNTCLILESLISLTIDPLYPKEYFFRAMKDLEINGKNNLHVQIIMIEFSIYFYKLTKDNEILEGVRFIKEENNLHLHFENLYKIIYLEEKIDSGRIEQKYPLNLIRLLSIEKKELLLQNKKNERFEIIEEFMSNISKMENEEDLFRVSEMILNKHFLSTGFIVLKKEKNLFDYKYCSIKNCTLLCNSLKLFIEQCEKVKDQRIFEFDDNEFLKSCVIERVIYEDEEDLSYFFIMFNQKKNQWNFSLEELKTYSILINNLYLKHKNIIQMKKIRLNSITDYLTGFKNPFYYNKVIKKFIENYNSKGENFSIVLIDLNDFKRINDTFGHDVGDKALRYFAQTLGKNINESVEFIRYGGDEFIILFNSKIRIEDKLINVKEFFKTNPLIEGKEKIILDFSFGLEHYNGQQEGEFFKIADKKMYQQKKKSKI